MNIASDHRPDLADRTDIIRVVDSFYERIRKDEKLGPIFNEIAQVDWAAHLPRMYDFWDSISSAPVRSAATRSPSTPGSSQRRT